MPDTEQRAWNFDRYVNGVLMAEGVSITRADTLEQAVKKAVQLCPKQQGTVLVLSDGIREEVRAEALEEAANLIENGWQNIAPGMTRYDGPPIRELPAAIRTLSQRQP